MARDPVRPTVSDAARRRLEEIEAGGAYTGASVPDDATTDDLRAAGMVVTNEHAHDGQIRAWTSASQADLPCESPDHYVPYERTDKSRCAPCEARRVLGLVEVSHAS